MKPFRPAAGPAPTASLFRSLRAATQQQHAGASSASPAWPTFFAFTAPRPSAARTPIRTYRTLRLRPSPSLRPFRAPRRAHNYSSNSKPSAPHSSASKTPNPTPHLGSPAPAPSFSQRMRKLSREYGWVALGVYLGLSVLDFPFCFLAVRMLGTDRIGRWEHAVVQAFWQVVHTVAPHVHEDQNAAGLAAGEAAAGAGDSPTAREGALGHSEEVVQAELRNAGADATIWTQLALAYAIHKSFIFLRVPLTAAVTPKVVKVLRGWGWNIGKKKPKA